MQFGYFWNSWPLLSSATSKVGLRTFIFCLFWSRKKGSRDFGVSIWTLHICTYHQNLWGVSARVNSYVELFTTHSFTMHCIFILMTWRDAYKIAWLWLWVISFWNCTIDTNDIYLFFWHGEMPKWQKLGPFQNKVVQIDLIVHNRSHANT